MPRALPSKPSLEHLKSQAKDLLDAHRRGEPDAFARIRAAVPAFAHRSDEQIARGPFALHDAQSAIAREYGFVSWTELRNRVVAMTEPSPEEVQAIQAMLAGSKLPAELEVAIRAAAALRGTQNDEPTPPVLPVIPVRNAVVFPGALVPLDISRPSSLQAIETAMQREPPFLAMFAQRAFDTEHPTREDLHPTGCLCIVRVLHRHAEDASPPPGATEPRRPSAWVLIEGVRFIQLESLDQLDPYYVARVADASIDRGDDQQIAERDRRLREMAHRFADTMPGSDQVHALIDQTIGAGPLADLVMAHLPMPVADMASYAEEGQLSRKLDRAIAQLGAALAKVQPAPG